MSRLLDALRRRREDERGALSAALPIIALSLLVLAGLGIDGSRQLNARGQAVAFAEEASRDGALGIDPAINGALVLEPDEVQRRVEEYCATVLKLEQVKRCDYLGISRGTQPDGKPDPVPLIVTVRVQTEIKPTLLGIVYPGTLTATGTGRARPVEGISDRIR